MKIKTLHTPGEQETFSFSIPDISQIAPLQGINFDFENCREKSERVEDTGPHRKTLAGIVGVSFQSLTCQYFEDVFQAKRSRHNTFRLRSRSLVKYPG